MAVGTYCIIAKADAQQTRSRRRQKPTTRVSGAVRIGPDLTVLEPDRSLGCRAMATTVNVSDVTTNAGGGDSGPSRTAFYLSTNLAYDAADKPIGGRDIGPLGVNRPQLPRASATTAGRDSGWDDRADCITSSCAADDATARDREPGEPTTCAGARRSRSVRISVVLDPDRAVWRAAPVGIVTVSDTDEEPGGRQSAPRHHDRVSTCRRTAHSTPATAWSAAGR